ncbi:MAG: nucleotidyltransferase family protein [Bacteroidetes bacterium]|nr:nucleotidyltransferase family protein [Bacteroidota bacterium]
MKLKNRAIILAAGSSKRMGSQKMLLPFGDSTILETVIQNVLSSTIDSALVVLGANHDQIRKVIDPLPVEVCINENHESGMLSSVICGFSALPDDTGTALVFLGDQPGIPPVVSNAVIEAYNESLHGIVIPVTDHRRGHPLLVDFKYKREIGRLDLEKGLRALMHHFPEDVLEVEVDQPGILLDIDTPEDYSNAIQFYTE